MDPIKNIAKLLPKKKVVGPRADKSLPNLVYPPSPPREEENNSIKALLIDTNKLKDDNKNSVDAHNRKNDGHKTCPALTKQNIFDFNEEDIEITDIYSEYSQRDYPSYSNIIKQLKNESSHNQMDFPKNSSKTAPLVQQFKDLALKDPVHPKRSPKNGSPLLHSALCTGVLENDVTLPCSWYSTTNMAGFLYNVDTNSSSDKKITNMYGPYKLGKTLGEGEFGKVKYAKHLDNEEEVAIKLIKKDTLDNSVKVAKLAREVSILISVSHPSIVKLYDIIETKNMIGVVLELASGGELFEYILSRKHLKDDCARKFFCQLVSGVAYLHSSGVVHRDLKLENLLLSSNNNLYISDFGFANTTSTEVLMSTSCGSPCYAAPELVTANGYVGESADIWSLGVILYAMLAGYLPFDDDPNNPDGGNINLLYKYILETELRFPSFMSESSIDLLKNILVPDPKKRYNMREIMEHEWCQPEKHWFSKEYDIITKSSKVQKVSNDFNIDFHLDKDMFEESFSIDSENASFDISTLRNTLGVPPSNLRNDITNSIIIPRVPEKNNKLSKNYEEFDENKNENRIDIPTNKPSFGELNSVKNESLMEHINNSPCFIKSSPFNDELDISLNTTSDASDASDSSHLLNSSNDTTSSTININPLKENHNDRENEKIPTFSPVSNIRVPSLISSDDSKPYVEPEYYNNNRSKSLSVATNSLLINGESMTALPKRNNTPSYSPRKSSLPTSDLSYVKSSYRIKKHTTPTSTKFSIPSTDEESDYVGEMNQEFNSRRRKGNSVCSYTSITPSDSAVQAVVALQPEKTRKLMVVNHTSCDNISVLSSDNENEQSNGKSFIPGNKRLKVPKIAISTTINDTIPSAIPNESNKSLSRNGCSSAPIDSSFKTNSLKSINLNHESDHDVFNLDPGARKDGPSLYLNKVVDSDVKKNYKKFSRKSVAANLVSLLSISNESKQNDGLNKSGSSYLSKSQLKEISINKNKYKQYEQKEIIQESRVKVKEKILTFGKKKQDFDTSQSNNLQQRRSFHGNYNDLKFHVGHIDQRTVSTLHPDKLMFIVNDILKTMGGNTFLIDTKEHYRLKVTQNQQLSIPRNARKLSLPDDDMNQPTSPFESTLPPIPSAKPLQTNNSNNDLQRNRFTNILQTFPTSISRKLKSKPLINDEVASLASSSTLASATSPTMIDPNSLLCFTLEIQRIKNLKGLVVIDIKRIRGDIWKFKQIYHDFVTLLQEKNPKYDLYV